MRILISLSYYFPNISGVSVYVRNLSTGLSKLGNKVSILTSRHKKDLPPFESIQDIDVYRVPVTLQIGRGPIMLTFLFKALKLVRQSDVINCHLPQFEGFILIILAKLFRKKVVTTYHVDLPMWPGLLNKISFYAVYFSNAICLFLSDKIVTHTEDGAKHSPLLKHFLKKIVYIFPPVVVENRKTKPIINNKIKNKIGFIGRISRQKGIEVLLSAIPFIKKQLGESMKIYIVGPNKEVIGENYLVEIEELLKRYKNDIEIMGKIEPDKLSSIYKSIDVLVLPSTQESFGLVQIEAMLNNIPVVATDLPGVRKVIEFTSMGEIAKVGDSKDLADKIVKVIKNKPAYLKFYPKAVDLFDIHKIIHEYIEAFEN